ncbi:MAG TPA: hypothetical protein VD963_07885, partial [Phycisphaerales bacterium]|nr:hypothetical protein [Phycisphaerales bacterium]
RAFPGFGLFFAAAPTDPGRGEELAGRLHAMYAQFAEQGPTEEEVQTARRQVANALDEAMREPAFWAQRLASLDYRGLTLDDVAGGPEAYQALAGPGIREVFVKYYTPASRLTITVRPQ